MIPKIKLLSILIALIFFTSSNTLAHGDLHERIQKVSQEINTYPDSAYLYVKRGKLHFQHSAYQKSISDLDKSQALNYNSTEQKLLFAKVYLELEEYHRAIFYADNILYDHPNNMHAYKIKGKANFQLKNFVESAYCFEEVLHQTNRNVPEDYINAASAWASSNSKQGNQQAFLVLEKGIDELGHVISLYKKQLEISHNWKDYQRCIDVQSQIIKISSRKEFGYLKLSELYLLKNDSKNAKKNLDVASRIFNQRPSKIKDKNNSKVFYQKLLSLEKKLKTN